MRSSGEQFVVYNPETDNSALIGTLQESGVTFSAAPPERQSFLMQLFISSFPILLLIGVWVYFMRQMQGGAGGRGAMSFGKSRARLLNEDQVTVTFADVAGVDEAKEEVGEIVDFLKDPGKFQKLGGKIPRGVLMVGSPGTGKTLLAKAIAGEAKVPFFTISGSDFVEMFVGVGASRVRDMFDQAKKHAPCIIFIDEIDAVGRHRGAGLGGGHDEREQTLNQLLVEMDGFEGNEGVIVIAATNRPDVLDPALLRPGRFDRQVVVPLPDVRGREQILKVHMRKLPLAEDVRPSIIARGTPGFSGADLANLVNEAALFAARANRRTVTMEEFDRAKDKIMMGAERKSMVMDDNEKKLTAYHEAGHAIVGLNVPDHDPVYKVTIIPRGLRAGRHDVPARSGPLQHQQAPAREPHRDAVRWTRRGGDDVRPRVRHDRSLERHRAGHRDRAQHGHEVGSVGPARHADLRGRGRRGLPRPLGHAAQAGRRQDPRRDRRGSPSRDRRELPARQGNPRARDREAAQDGRDAHQVRDDRRRADRDIMAGREPRQPDDWEDRDAPTTGTRPRERREGDAPPGKPAPQH